MRTTIEMAREAAGDDWGLFQEYMPEIHRLAELVRADERARMAEQPAQRKSLTPEWYARWIRNNYQDHPNIATLCDEMTKAAHGIKENT